MLKKPLCGKIFTIPFFRQHLCKIFVINALYQNDAHVQMLVRIEGCENRKTFFAQSLEMRALCRVARLAVLMSISRNLAFFKVPFCPAEPGKPSNFSMVSLRLYFVIDRGFLTWGPCTPGVTFKDINRRENMFIYYLFPNVYAYISEYYFQKPLHAYC